MNTSLSAQGGVYQAHNSRWRSTTAQTHGKSKLTFPLTNGR